MRGPGPMKDELRQYAGGPPLPVTPTVPGDAPTQRITRQASPGDAPDIIAEVAPTVPSTYVIRESWHPRWKVFVDGAAVPIRRVTPDFMAVDVPAGTHTITARFDRPWWAWASWLCIPLTIALGALFSGRHALRNRRARRRGIPAARVT